MSIKWKIQKSKKYKVFVFLSTSYIWIYREIEAFGGEFYYFEGYFLCPFFQYGISLYFAFIAKQSKQSKILPKTPPLKGVV